MVAVAPATLKDWRRRRWRRRLAAAVALLFSLLSLGNNSLSLLSRFQLSTRQQGESWDGGCLVARKVEEGEMVVGGGQIRRSDGGSRRRSKGGFGVVKGSLVGEMVRVLEMDEHEMKMCGEKD